MNDIILITGGCRSGKSRHALELADGYRAGRKLFIATLAPLDDEMRRRVARHRAERSPDWTTLEEPVRLAEMLVEQRGRTDLILIDCLTLWITNLMMAEKTDREIEDAVAHLAATLAETTCPVILVTNEVGAGIVPENAMARRFRDLAGLANQQTARQATGVIWMVAGIPVQIK